MRDACVASWAAALEFSYSCTFHEGLGFGLNGSN